MKEENKKYEYVIGIDLGHGETSAAICPIQWDTPVDQLDPVKDLEMGGNKKVIPSAITIIDDNTAHIGDSAFNSEVLRKAEVHVCFKKAPKDIKGEAEKIMIRFMSEIYKSIRANNAAILSEGNHLVYIATPSGWDKTTQQLYVKMAQKAGIPILDNGVTKESRAAFVRAQQDTTSGIGRNISKGAIVFDMGSSTLDFTYMNDALPNLIDNGYDCGASHVEKIIFSDCENESEAVRLFEKKYPKLADFLLFEARKVKEQAYFDPTLKVKKTIHFEDFIEDDELEDECFKIAFQPGELDKVLEDKGYINMIAQAMIDYKRNYIPNQKIHGVFLTGGASRMDFIKGLVSKCWEVPEDKIYRDQDPSLTISQGVAEVARMDLRTEGMDVGLSEEIDLVLSNDSIYETFVGTFGYALWDNVTDVVADEFKKFSESSMDKSVNDLKGAINSRVRSAISEVSSDAPAHIQNAIDENLGEVQNKVASIIEAYSRQGISVNVSMEDVNIPQVSSVNLDGVMKDISKSIETSSSTLDTVLSTAMWGGLGAAILFGGPLAWIIGGGAALAKWIFGESETEEEKQRKAMAKKLSIDERIGVLNNFADKWEGVQKSIEQSIDNSLRKDQSLKITIGELAEKVVTSYKENLKSARILID